MKKRDIFINILSFVLWMLIFVPEIFGFEEWKFKFFATMAMLFVLPVIICIYDTIISEDSGSLTIKTIFMGTSNFIGMLFSTALSDSFIEPDSELGAVLPVFWGIIFVYTVILDLVCRFVNKKLTGK